MTDMDREAMTDAIRRSMSCPACGAAGLIPAHGRAYVDVHGREREHDDSCRCRWCGWWWWDDRDPVACACGAVVRVVVDDGYAYAEVTR